MDPRITGSIVKQDPAALLHDCAVGKDHVRDISDTLLPPGSKQQSARLGDYIRGVLQRSGISIKHIAKTSCSHSNTVSNMQPTLSSADRYNALTVLGLRDLMIFSLAKNLFLFDDSASDIIRQSKAYATA
jgi:hypothetical protein